jgi:hypothetical protein
MTCTSNSNINKLILLVRESKNSIDIKNESSLTKITEKNEESERRESRIENEDKAKSKITLNNNSDFKIEVVSKDKQKFMEQNTENYNCVFESPKMKTVKMHTNSILSKISDAGNNN